ncbi:MAG: FecR domain-containing protein [Pseudomonadota bacterium]
MKIIIFLCTLLAYSSITSSKEQCGKNCIGRVAKIVGAVERINTQQNISGPIASGDVIAQGDKLKTGPDAYIKVLMKDDTIFQLGAQSEFIFKRFAFRTKEDRQADYDMSFGQLRALIINKAKDNDITIKTPAVSLGVRGTEFALNAFQRDGVWQTDIALLRGQLKVALLNINKNNVILDAGKILHVSAVSSGKKTPFQEQQISPAMQQQLKKAADEGGSVFLPELSGNDNLLKSHIGKVKEEKENLGTDSEDKKKKGPGSSSSAPKRPPPPPGSNLPSGSTQPLTPGLTPPLSPGSTQPLSPGLTQPLSPGSTQPLSPGLTQPPPPGSNLPSGLTQPPPPGSKKPFKFKP